MCGSSYAQSWEGLWRLQSLLLLLLLLLQQQSL
jgi:hypothetical protein